MKLHLAKALLLPLSIVLAGSAHADISQREDVQGFIAEMTSNHKFDPKQLTAMFREIELDEDILRAISRPAEGKPWHQYRPIFLTETRIEGGVEFFKEHADTLARAEAEFGVAAEVIVAILGVETRYGRHKGGYRVAESLSTLAFGYPKRASFFRRQLEEYLLMAREEGFDPLDLTGSYAGAMGYPQFIPSSFRAYAVDFDGDRRRDLWNSVEDVIGSVANYFARHKWQTGAPVASPAVVKGERYPVLVDLGYKPSLPVRELREWGVTAEKEFAPEAKAALIALETEEGHEHWVALHNFYVITRYNHSPLYAMVVHQLAEAIRERIASGKTAPPADA